MTRFSPGFIFPNVASALTGLTYQGNAAINNDGPATKTFSAKAIGAAAANRWVMVLVAFKNGTARTLDSATIGGVTATIQDQTSITGSNGRVAIVYANVPSGTTADIVLTFSGTFTVSTANGAGIDWFNFYGPLNTTPTDTYKDETVNAPSKTFTVPAGGLAFVIGTANNVNAAVTGDFTVDDNFIQYVAGNARWDGHKDNSGSGSSASAAWTGSNWSASSATCSKLGAAFGVV